MIRTMAKGWKQWLVFFLPWMAFVSGAMAQTGVGKSFIDENTGISAGFMIAMVGGLGFVARDRISVGRKIDKLESTVERIEEMRSDIKELRQEMLKIAKRGE